jgi:hypothetical protein
MAIRRLPLLGAVLIAVAMLLPASAGASLNQWHLVNPDINGASVVSMTSLSGHPGSLYVATFDGFHRSADGGASWSTSSVPPCLVATMAVDASDPSVVYIGCAQSGGVIKSSDGGATWTPINQGLADPSHPDQLPTIDSLVIDPSDPSTLYLSTLVDPLGDIFVTHDGGATWASIHAGSGAGALALNGGRLYAYDDGIITSDDAGQTWSQPAAVEAELLVADPSDAQTVYAVALDKAAGGGVAVTTDGGQTWAAPAGGPTHILSAAALGGTLYLGTLGGASASDDQAQTWLSSGVDIGGDAIEGYAIAPDPATAGHVWVGTDFEGVWETTFDQNTVAGYSPYWLAGTLPATDVTPTSARLNGVVAATYANIDGMYTFLWGTDSTYADSTGFQQFPAITQTGVEAPVSAELTGLTPSTTYHVHLYAFATFWSTGDDTRPGDVTFTTPAAVAPSVASAPLVSFRHAAAVPGLVPVRVAWHATTGTYPICATSLQVSTDGGSFRPVALAGSPRRSVDTALAPGHRYGYRVDVSDCHGGRSGWSTSPSATIRAYAGPPHIDYSPAWHLDAAGYRDATAAGARATMAFNGRAVSIFALTGRAFGSARVYVDGSLVTTLHLHRDAPGQSRLVFCREFGATGEHIVTVRVVGGGRHPRVALGGFAVIR